MGEGRGVYRVLVGRPEGKRPLGRPRRRWHDNVKLDLREIRIDVANWIQLAQDRVQWRAFVNTMSCTCACEPDVGGEGGAAAICVMAATSMIVGSTGSTFRLDRFLAFAWFFLVTAALLLLTTW
jgi:hypothetical protein